MKNYNIRDKFGRFTRKPITKNKLFDFKGITVRTKEQLDSGFWWVSYHKKLYGEAHESELKFIDKKKVNEYLKKV